MRTLAFVVALVLSTVALGEAAVAGPPPETQTFTDSFSRSGQVTHKLPDGGKIVITVTGPDSAAGSRRARGSTQPLFDSNWVQYGINRYNCCGDLLWTFSETVNWGWDYTQVTFTSPTSAASVWYPGWYVESKSTPYWYWVVYPTKSESYAQAVLRCCGPFPVQTDNPQIWIWTDAWGNWQGRSQCC